MEELGAFARLPCRCADSECEHRQEIIPELPPKKADRVKGQKYINKKGKKCTWDGRRLRESCFEDGCNKRPYFNKEGQTTGLYCGVHKKDNMINVVSKRCYEDGCNKIPNFNHEGQTTGLYCAFHKEDNMINVVNKRCYEDGCNTEGIPKFEGYCMPCFINNPLNADKPAHRNYKTKEKEVGLAITQRFPDATWILDKRIQDGCSARRPDVLMDLGYHVLMVEVDENQHNNYDCSCENKRLMEIWQDLGHRSMVVFRFNPDAYETLQGERVPSCWKHNKKGIVHIPKEQQKNWDARIEVLLETIQYWIDNQSEKQIEIVELFY